ncbi:hypothetical protein HPB48_006625 [Haemaphysalis longicornis]|uniref:Uncharacterized protein n=1 Tax=Haemaphysalis longicornis TaxID=44386 RepID=A0A9J6GU55_HAELO|nr:hypothetical protein HPB48_006625 [Haemaphysalis longicornis]
MPTSGGLLEGQPVVVLRDTGCNTVIVNRSLVADTKLTGGMSTVHLLNRTCLSLPETDVEIDSPFFSGRVLASCIDNPFGASGGGSGGQLDQNDRQAGRGFRGFQGLRVVVAPAGPTSPFAKLSYRRDDPGSRSSEARPSERSQRRVTQRNRDWSAVFRNPAARASTPWRLSAITLEPKVREFVRQETAHQLSLVLLAQQALSSLRRALRATIRQQFAWALPPANLASAAVA